MLALVSVMFLLRGLDTLESIFKLIRKTLHVFHGALGKLDMIMVRLNLGLSPHIHMGLSQFLGSDMTQDGLSYRPTVWHSLDGI